MRYVILTESATFGSETGAGLMRNRCAFTSRDMAADWPEAFVWAVVMGWDADPDDPEDESVMVSLAAKHGWDEPLIAFLRDAHERFKALADRTTPERPATAPRGAEAGEA